MPRLRQFNRISLLNPPVQIKRSDGTHSCKIRVPSKPAQKTTKKRARLAATEIAIREPLSRARREIARPAAGLTGTTRGVEGTRRGADHGGSRAGPRAAKKRDGTTVAAEGWARAKQIIHTQTTPFQYRAEAQGQKKGEMPVSLLLSLCAVLLPLPLPLLLAARRCPLLWCLCLQPAGLTLSSSLALHHSPPYTTTLLALPLVLSRSSCLCSSLSLSLVLAVLYILFYSCSII